MIWRSEARGRELRSLAGAPNRMEFTDLMEGGDVSGCLAFDGDQPVGWSSTGPQRTFPWLVRTRSLATGWDAETWSITCIFVKRPYRQRGVATMLCRLAVTVAARHGARALEAYPAVPFNKAGRFLPLSHGPECRLSLSALVSRASKGRVVLCI